MMPENTIKKDDEACCAVRNATTRTTVGMYTAQKAQSLADEWNELAYRARQTRPYVVVHFSEVEPSSPCDEPPTHPPTPASASG